VHPVKLDPRSKHEGAILIEFPGIGDPGVRAAAMIPGDMQALGGRSSQILNWKFMADLPGDQVS